MRDCENIFFYKFMVANKCLFRVAIKWDTGHLWHFFINSSVRIGSFFSLGNFLSAVSYFFALWFSLKVNGNRFYCTIFSEDAIKYYTAYRKKDSRISKRNKNFHPERCTLFSKNLRYCVIILK